MVGQQRRGIGLVLIIAFALVAVAATPALAYDPGDDDLTIAPPCPTTTQSSSPTLSFCTNNDDSNICNDQMKKSDTNNIGPLTINTVRVQVYICVDREYTDTGDYTCDFYAHWTADGYLPITESNHVESPVEYEYHGKLKRSSDQADRLDTIIKEGTEPGPVHQYNEERWTLQPGEGGVSKAEIQRTDPLGGFSHSAHATVQRTC